MNWFVVAWCHHLANRSGSVLAQLMAWYPMTPSHYLNHCFITGFHGTYLRPISLELLKISVCKNTIPHLLWGNEWPEISAWCVSMSSLCVLVLQSLVPYIYGPEIGHWCGWRWLSTQGCQTISRPVVDCISKKFHNFHSGPLLTKRGKISNHKISWSLQAARFANSEMKFDRHLSSSIAEMPVKLQSNTIMITSNLMALRLLKNWQ